MGLDPEDDSFLAGDECELCVDELFDGTTPVCVIAIVQDIEACPDYPAQAPPIPNGVFQLTQVAPCSWEFTDDNGIGFVWRLLAGNSYFWILSPAFHWFYARIEADCYDAFPNGLDCEDYHAIATGGYVTVWWGPGLCKGPCE